MKCKLESCNEEVAQPGAGRPRLFHSPACRVAYWNAVGRPVARVRHSITEVDEATRTGSCEKCERRVKVFRVDDTYADGRSRVRWVCAERVKEAPSRKRYNASDKRKAAAMRSRYGLTAEQLAAALTLNTGACHICDRETDVRRLVYDHCHTSLNFRGWLCDNCNLMLGNSGDDPARLRRAAEYLEATTANH